jgi:hypothetical protein
MAQFCKHTAEGLKNIINRHSNDNIFLNAKNDFISKRNDFFWDGVD